MNVVSIIQARMGSTRLPGKVLRNIGGRTVLAQTFLRAARADRTSSTVIATTTGENDNAVVAEAEALGAPVFRGSEDDVLERYYQTASAFEADAVVRITSDCPLIDPGVIDHVIEAFISGAPDYASNILQRTYPRGLDTEVFTVDALKRAWKGADKPYQRVHVTPYMYQNHDRFRCVAVTAAADYSRHRWTVDTADDLEFLRAVCARIEDPITATWNEVIECVESEPRLQEMNKHVRQKSLHEG